MMTTPGPVCAFGSEAERMVPERTVMAACRSAEVMRLSAQNPGRGKAAYAAPGREGHRSAVLEGAGPAVNSEETLKQV